MSAHASAGKRSQRMTHGTISAANPSAERIHSTTAKPSSPETTLSAWCVATAMIPVPITDANHPGWK